MRLSLKVEVLFRSCYMIAKDSQPSKIFIHLKHEKVKKE